MARKPLSDDTKKQKIAKVKAHKKQFKNKKASQLTAEEKDILLLNIAADLGYIKENDIT